MFCLLCLEMLAWRGGVGWGGGKVEFNDVSTEAIQL